MREPKHFNELEKRISDLEGKIRSVDAIAQEVMHCKRMEEELSHRLQFEGLISEISTEFINLVPAEIDAGINHALQKVGRFAQADRGYVFQMNHDGTRMSNTHESCAGKIPPKIDTLQDLPVSAFPWAIETLRRENILHVSSVADFPPEAEHEKKQFIDMGVKAFVVFAMKSNNRLTGFVGFDWIRHEETYSEDVASLLHILGVVFGNALERKNDEQARERLIHELQGIQEELLTLSIRDQLTGLFNRRHMEESLRREISRAVRHKTNLSLIMLDVDYFKDVNDTYGHMAGDIVLQKIGELLVERSRGEDVACRYGGEEFVLIMPGAAKESAVKRAKELCQLVSGAMVIEYRKSVLPPLTISLGVASFPENGETTESLLYEADNALYQAKEGGRNRVVAAEEGGEKAR